MASRFRDPKIWVGRTGLIPGKFGSVGQVSDTGLDISSRRWHEGGRQARISRSLARRPHRRDERYMNQIGFRTPRPGPELKLVAEAMQAGLASLFSSTGEAYALLEPEIAGWYPDVVLVYPLPEGRTSGPLPSTRALRLLHEVYRARGVRIETIASRSYLRRRDLMDQLEELSSCGFISGLDRGVVRCRPKRDVFGVRSIISIEAKVKDWRRAICQAQRNQWFSSASYVLLPARAWSSRGLENAKAAGVGAVSYEGGKLRVMHRPTTASVPSSYGSWYAALAALQTGHGECSSNL